MTKAAGAGLSGSGAINSSTLTINSGTGADIALNNGNTNLLLTNTSGAVSILVNSEPVDALGMLVHRNRAETRGRGMVEKMDQRHDRTHFLQDPDALLAERGGCAELPDIRLAQRVNRPLQLVRERRRVEEMHRRSGFTARTPRKAALARESDVKAFR